MAKRRDADEGRLSASAARPERGDALDPGQLTMDGEDGAEEELSLEEILVLYGQPINEEQAWAVCYQCCCSLARGSGGKSKSRGASAGCHAGRIGGPGDVRIRKDGSVRLQHQDAPGNNARLRVR